MADWNRTGVRLEPFAAILRRQIELSPPERISAYNNPYNAGLGDRIGASGLMTTAAAKRRVWSILNPTYENRGKVITQAVVDLDTADKILTALDLTHLWHTELADAIVIPKCNGCGVSSEDTVYTPSCGPCIERKHRRKKNADERDRLRRNELAAQSPVKR